MNCDIVTEPDFPYMDAISPFQPLQMKVVHCPIDTSLNFTQATKLIRELKPGTLVIPESYTRGPQISSSQRIDLLIDVVSISIIMGTHMPLATG